MLFVCLEDLADGEAIADDGGDTAITVVEWAIIRRLLASSPSC